jgi:FkbM family methyltransferase
MSPRIASGVLRALTQRQNYRAGRNIFRYIGNPWRTMFGYLTLGKSGFPRPVRVRTPTGPYELTLYSADDLITVVECFARLDYEVGKNIRCVVDIGSNIGISALYFLSRNDYARVYLFEPVPRNIERLEQNLIPFSGRYQVDSSAIGTSAGTASFGCEPTGRYGGIGLSLSESISVAVKDVNDVLATVLAKEGTIDVLKLDVEGMEVAILSHLASDVLERIRVIYAETFGAGPVLPGFSRYERGAIVIYSKSEPLPG